MLKRLLYTLPILGVLLITGCGPSETGSGEVTGQTAASGVQEEVPQDETNRSDEDGSTADAENSDSSEPVVLILGDSIAAGYGLQPEQAFPALLQARLDSLGIPGRIVNAGLSGETSAAGLRRIDWLLRQPVDVFVLELGGNDGLRGVDLASTRQNLNGIIDRVKAENPQVVVVVAGMMIPTNLGPDYTREFASIFPEVAENHDAILIPFLLDGVGGVDALMQGDQIHPNAAGHQAITDLVEPYLLEALNAVPEEAGAP